MPEGIGYGNPFGYLPMGIEAVLQDPEVREAIRDYNNETISRDAVTELIANIMGQMGFGDSDEQQKAIALSLIRQVENESPRWHSSDELQHGGQSADEAVAQVIANQSTPVSTVDDNGLVIDGLNQPAGPGNVSWSDLVPMGTGDGTGVGTGVGTGAGLGGTPDTQMVKDAMRLAQQELEAEGLSGAFRRYMTKSLGNLNPLMASAVARMFPGAQEGYYLDVARKGMEGNWQVGAEDQFAPGTFKNFLSGGAIPTSSAGFKTRFDELAPIWEKSPEDVRGTGEQFAQELLNPRAENLIRQSMLAGFHPLFRAAGQRAVQRGIDLFRDERPTQSLLGNFFGGGYRMPGTWAQ